jgi:hypothetical protein
MCLFFFCDLYLCGVATTNQKPLRLWRNSNSETSQISETNARQFRHCNMVATGFVVGFITIIQRWVFLFGFVLRDPC